MRRACSLQERQCGRLFAAELDPARVTYMEVKGGVHGFDHMPNTRAFAMLDCMTAWLAGFKQRYHK